MASYTFDNTFYGYNKKASPKKEDDGNASLTYSAASGESNDSSFAGILRALERQENDSEFILKKEQTVSSNVSLSGYSTDGESCLAGTELLQTIAGQPSSEFSNDKQEDTIDMSMFHPPRQPNMKKKKRPVKATEESPSSSVDTPTRDPLETPPMSRRNRESLEKEEAEETWSRPGCCFAETFDLLREMPKRYK